MKNLKRTALLLGLFIFSVSSFGQSNVPEPTGIATVTEDYCVTLSTEKPLQNYYEIDITDLALESEYMAKKRFGHINNNLLTYHVDYSNSRVILEVHWDRVKETTDVNWWNTYLSDLCK
ncbi:MAG: hypothetical protein MI810_20700 [Flavobacteriales bacterium]|nr:hypothetical protein [Flavobacteriales bacterium]